MKHLKIVLIALLCAAILLPLLACSPREDDDTPPADQTPMLTLAENGQSLYRIVRSDLLATDAHEVQAAIKLRDAMGKVLGNAPDIKTDWEDKDDNEGIKEILVGQTTRTASKEVYASLGADEYAICVKGNKIVLAGATADLLNHAVTVFLREWCGYLNASSYTQATTLSVPEQLNIKEAYTMPSRITLFQAKDKISYTAVLCEQLRGAGLQVTEYTADTDPAAVFDASATDLVIIAGADTFTNTSISALENYLKKQGRVLLLGGPAMETMLYELDGEWYDRTEYAQALLAQVEDDAKEVLLPLSDPDFVAKHSRSTSHVSNRYEVTVDDYGLDDGSDGQMYHYVDKMENWDMLSFGNLNVQGEDYNALTFYAKPANDSTTGLSVEIQEKGGIRWYTNISFTSDDWQPFMLTPSDFIWWQDGNQPESNVPNFDNIAIVQIGFANSFLGMAPDSYAYYCSEMVLYSTDQKMPTASAVPTIEGISPMYELYPITNAKNLITCDNQSFISERAYVLPDTLFSCHPGRQATGYGKGSTARFIPLIRVTDENDLHSGYAAWIHLLACTTTKNGAFEGAMLGTFSSSDDDFYNADGIAAVVETALAMTGDAFLIDGGTTEHIYVTADTDTITAGATYLSSGDTAPEVKIELYEGDRLLCTVNSKDTAPKSAANGLYTVSGNYALSGGKPDRAVVTLSVGGVIVDGVTQEISYWEAKPESERSYIYMEDGYFKRDGEIISFFGVNYMPSYGVAEADGAMFEHYISDGAYDPTTILYDLQRIKDIGMNAVSIFCYYDYVKDCNNILDLVNKCEQMGIYVDLSIRPYAYPLNDNYSYEQVQTLVQRLHFNENDNIIAYDIAWEPRVGSYEQNSMYVGRQRWDDDWLQWIKDNYGSVDHAFSLWGTKIPLNNRGVPVITDAMLDNTASTYKKAIAAYYSFLDEVIAANMQLHMVAMQALAPQQMFSFRMSMSGSTMRSPGTYPSNMCFDFQSLASTLAFMEPEGYALGLSDEASLQIMFANAYARYTKPEAPVVWKEFGRHVWAGPSNSNFSPSSSLLRVQEEYYRYALDYCLKSYTSGMFCWYYAGGYRIGENSDYGILNPDGSDRPVTQLLRDYAPLFINQGEREVIEITIERDDYVGGIYGMFDAVKAQLASAYKQGKAVTFINKQQTSATEYAYADELLGYAVGGTAADGQYPLRYVGGQIKNVEFTTENGAQVAKITVCNTKQSSWRAGTVSVVSIDGSGVTLGGTVNEELSYLEETTLTVPVSGSGKAILRFKIGDTLFGIRYEVSK